MWYYDIYPSFKVTVAIWPRVLINIHLSIIFVLTETGKLIARHTVPQSLSQYMVICSDGEKPLMVLYLVTQLKFQGVLCFTSTLEATHRYSTYIALTNNDLCCQMYYLRVSDQAKGVQFMCTLHEKKKNLVFVVLLRE